MAGLLTAAQLANIEVIANRGYQTLEDWTLTDTITIARQSGVVGTFAVVGIRPAGTQERATGAGTPLAETELDGVLKLWTDDVTASPVHRGDRFLWNGQAVVIATPPMFKRGGVAEYGFTLQARNT